MAFDRGLEERLYDYFNGRHDLTVKKMFGGLCFLLSGHMCCVIIDERLMARVGPHNYLDALAQPHVTEMDFTGKPINGLVYILPEGFESDADLAYWVAMCVTFVSALPPKPPKESRRKKSKKKKV